MKSEKPIEQHLAWSSDLLRAGSRSIVQLEPSRPSCDQDSAGSSRTRKYPTGDLPYLELVVSAGTAHQQRALPAQPKSAFVVSVHHSVVVVLVEHGLTRLDDSLSQRQFAGHLTPTNHLSSTLR